MENLLETMQALMDVVADFEETVPRGVGKHREAYWTALEKLHAEKAAPVADAIRNAAKGHRSEAQINIWADGIMKGGPDMICTRLEEIAIRMGLIAE